MVAENNTSHLLLILRFGHRWRGTADLCSPGTEAPAGMLHQLGLAGMSPHKVSPARQLRLVMWWLQAQEGESRTTGSQRLRPKLASVPLATFHRSKLTQDQPRFKEEEILLRCMFSGPSVECSSTRWRKWQRTCGIFNSRPSLMCQKLLNLPLGVWSSLLAGDVGMDAGEQRGVSHAEERGFRSRAGLLTQGSAHITPGTPQFHTVQLHQPGITAWDSVLHVLVFAIKKFSGPSSVLKLVPTKTKSFHLQRRA